MNLRRQLKNYLLTGIFIVAPATISLIVLLWFVSTIDRTVAVPIEAFIGREVPGLGLLLGGAFLLLTGWLASSIFGQHLLEYFEEILLRIPVFNWLYKIVKQLTEVFSPNSKMAFRSVVMIEYPRKGTYSIGFMTNKLHASGIGERGELVSIYVPTNHLYIGSFVLVPKADVVETALTLQEGIQSVLSAGASLPAQVGHKNG